MISQSLYHNRRGAQNKAQTDFWGNVKFSFSFKQIQGNLEGESSYLHVSEVTNEGFFPGMYPFIYSVKFLEQLWFWDKTITSGSFTFKRIILEDSWKFLIPII